MSVEKDKLLKYLGTLDGPSIVSVLERQVDKNIHIFNMTEIKALYRGFKHEWLNRKDDELIKVTDRISEIMRNDELSRRNSETT